MALLCAVPTFADDGGEEITLRPTHRFRLPESDSVRGAVFAPDGETLYVHLHIEAINVWALGVHYWPELLIGAAVLAVLVAAVWVRRALRRPRHADRSLRRGLTRPIALCMVVCAVPVVLLVADVPRDGRVQSWRQWWSADLCDWAQRHDAAWLLCCKASADRIVEVDIGGLRVRGTVFTRGGYVEHPLVISPDGRFLLFFQDGKGLIQRRVSTGGAIRVFRPPWATHRHSQRNFVGVAGFSADGQTAYCVWVTWQGRTTELYACDLDSGGMDLVLKLDAEVRQGFSPDSALVMGQRFVFLATSDSAGRLLELPGPYATDEGQPSDVRLRGLDDPERIVRSFSAPIRRFDTPAFSPDGSIMYIRDVGSADIIAVDLADGEPRRLSGDAGLEPGVLPRGLVIAAAGRLLLVHGSPLDDPRRATVWIYDLRRNAWAGRLSNVSRRMTGRGVVPSPDGRTLVLLDLTGSVLLYDLSELLTEPDGV